ncbi:glycosyl hydrolase family 28-related protein [Acinetobacter bereziniae]|uniref:glycosyl hydrolase family 28-related protein n=1 Tax=Acinetobacter bereziniae TaxID=106648 RepID=UPI002FD907C8
MTVENQLPLQHFTANGNTKTFAINFAVEGKDNIKVTANGEVVTVDAYSYDNLTKAVVFNIAPVVDTAITIERVTSLDRSISYATYNNSFRPETLNYDLDRIIRILQEQGYTDAVVINDLAQEIYERSQQNSELRGQIEDHSLSLITIQTIQQEETNKRINGDNEVALAARAYTDFMLTMNNTNPSIFSGIADNIVITETGETQRQINSKNVSNVASIYELSLINKPKENQIVFVSSYHINLNKGGGLFIYKSSKKNVYDGVVNFNGWVRIGHDNKVSITDAGAKGDGVTDDQPFISTAYEYLNSIGGGTLYIPNGTYLINTVNYATDGTLNQQFAFPIYNNIQILGESREKAIFRMANGVIYKDLMRANLGCALFADAHLAVKIKNFSLKNFKVDMNGINNTIVNLPTTGGIDQSVQQAVFPMLYIFDYYGSENVIVDNVWVHQNSGMNSIYIGHKSTNTIIQNCLFTDHSDYITGNQLIKDHSTIYIGGFGNKVLNNSFVMGHDAVLTLNPRTKISYISTAIEAHGVGTIVSGNYVDGYGAPFLAASTEWYNGEDILFTGNIALGCQLGFSFNSYRGQLKAMFTNNRVFTRKEKASRSDNNLRFAHAAVESMGAINTIEDRTSAYSEIFVLNNYFEQEVATDWDSSDNYINSCQNIKEVKLYVSKGNTFKNYKGAALDILVHRDHLQSELIVEGNTYINCGNSTDYSVYRGAYIFEGINRTTEEGFKYGVLKSLHINNEHFSTCSYGVLITQIGQMLARNVTAKGIEYMGNFIPPFLSNTGIDYDFGQRVHVEYTTNGRVLPLQDLANYKGLSGSVQLKNWSDNVDYNDLQILEYQKTSYYTWNANLTTPYTPTEQEEVTPFPKKTGDRHRLVSPQLGQFSEYLCSDNGTQLVWVGIGKVGV